MARQPRLNIAEWVDHVTQRGVEQRDIVVDDEGRQEWLRLFGRNTTRCAGRVCAYALLTNHFHIFLSSPESKFKVCSSLPDTAFVTLRRRNH